jgi:hypothetical protein
MKKLLLVICLLFSLNPTAFANEKYDVNVLNVFCLGGSLKNFTRQYTELNLLNDDRYSNVKVLRIDKSSINQSEIQLINKLNYQNLKTITLKSLNNKIYSVHIEYENSQEPRNLNAKNELNTLRLATDLTIKYGQGLKTEGNNEEFWSVSWGIKNYVVGLSCFRNEDCSLTYYLPKVAENIVSNSGL